MDQRSDEEAPSPFLGRAPFHLDRDLRAIFPASESPAAGASVEIGIRPGPASIRGTVGAFGREERVERESGQLGGVVTEDRSGLGIGIEQETTLVADHDSARGRFGDDFVERAILAADCRACSVRDRFHGQAFPPPGPLITRSRSGSIT